MAINKVVYGNSTLIDLTEDTVSANNLLAGETAHDRSGAPVVGSVVTAEVVDNLTTQDATKALSANQGYVLNQKKIDKTASEIQTSDGQFTTVTGGLMQSCVVDLEPIQSGSGVPSPSNVRAISGHTQVQVGNSGKQNMIDPNNMGHYGRDNTTGQIDRTENTLSSNTNLIKVKPSTTYTISRNGTAYGGRVFYYNSNKEYINNTVDYNKMVFTTPNNCYYVAFQSGYANGALDLWCMTEGSTVVPYKPFDGYTTTINLGGTYYGGTLDAVSGVLTVTHARVDLGSYTWGKTGANLFFVEYPRDFKKAVYASGFWYANGDCECYKFIQDSITSEDGVINLYFEEARSFYRMFVNDSSRYSLSASDFKTAVTGQYLVYELATPQTIQLTPTQLETLVGQNDVFAPLVGQSVEEVEFREVMTLDDVIDAIPYESVSPDVGTGETYTYFRIHRYGRVVVFTFMQDSAIQIVEQATRKIFGVLPERFYTKISGAMPYNTIKYTFINQNRFGVFVPKLLEIDPTNGNVYADYEADEGICPMGSLTYILDHD